MDKNTLTGFALIGLVIFGFTWWSQPSEAERAEIARQDSIALVEQAKAEKAELQKMQQEAEQKALAAQDSSALFFENRTGAGEKITLKNNVLELTLNTKGAQVEGAKLLQHNTYEGDPVVLLDGPVAALDMQLATKTENLHLNEMTFTIADANESYVTLRMGSAEQGIDITYQLVEDSYLTNITLQAHGIAGQFAPNANKLYINYNTLTRQLEKGYSFESRNSALTYKEQDGDVDDLSAAGEDDEQPKETLSWVAFKNQFFSSVLLSTDGFTEAQLKSKALQKYEGLKLYGAKMQTAFDPQGITPTQLQLYTGPNDFHLLQAHNKQAIIKDAELEELVDLGWPLFRWINRWLILPIFDFLKGMGLSMGIVLLLLTLIVKGLVYPATRKSYLSSARMRVLKPEVDKIAAKYTKQEDALKKQQETMQLYSQYGVSPMGGCLPMMIQMPIWIALFNFVPGAIELRGESFLWADDLSAYDDLISWGKDLWLIGDHISIFCLLFSLTNIGNTIISMRQQQNSMMSAEQQQQMKMMQWMMYAMPVIFFFTFNNYSSGLCYYYFLSGLSSILIMWGLRKFTNDDKLLAQLQAYKQKHANDPKSGMGGLAARLEAMQKLAEEQQRQRQGK